MATTSYRKTPLAAGKFAPPVIKPIRNVWLAALGAASLTRKEAAKIFDRLVNEGEKLEKKTKDTMERGKAEATERLSNIADSIGETTSKAKNALQRPAKPLAYHLLPKDDGWTVRLEGSERDISVHATKESALDAARGLAQAHEPSRLIVHRADGTIQTSHTYGEDA